MRWLVGLLSSRMLGVFISVCVSVICLVRLLDNELMCVLGCRFSWVMVVFMCVCSCYVLVVFSWDCNVCSLCSVFLLWEFFIDVISVLYLVSRLVVCGIFIVMVLVMVCFGLNLGFCGI